MNPDLTTSDAAARRKIILLGVSAGLVLAFVMVYLMGNGGGKPRDGVVMDDGEAFQIYAGQDDALGFDVEESSSLVEVDNEVPEPEDALWAHLKQEMAEAAPQVDTDEGEATDVGEAMPVGEVVAETKKGQAAVLREQTGAAGMQAVADGGVAVGGEGAAVAAAVAAAVDGRGPAVAGGGAGAGGVVDAGTGSGEAGGGAGSAVAAAATAEPGSGGTAVGGAAVAAGAQQVKPGRVIVTKLRSPVVELVPPQKPRAGVVAHTRGLVSKVFFEAAVKGDVAELVKGPAGGGELAAVTREQADAFAGWMTRLHRELGLIGGSQEFRLPRAEETSSPKIWRVDDAAVGAGERRPFGLVLEEKDQALAVQYERSVAERVALAAGAGAVDELMVDGIPVRTDVPPGVSALEKTGPDKPLWQRPEGLKP
jgi:hypothetical protein